jgi:hypothetical protein
MARLAERVRRLEAAYPADWCPHRPPLVVVDGALEMGVRNQVFKCCPCGRPPLLISVEYVDAP